MSGGSTPKAIEPLAAGARILRVDALEAHRRMREEGYVYVDVRTEAEYAAGHPAGALNLPWQLPGPSGLVPNPDFVELVGQLFGPGARLLFGCKSGVRSLRAAEASATRGHGELLELRPGYDGLRDAFGRVREPGWLASGLPVERHTEGGSYTELVARARDSRAIPESR
jgi:rhodanese-related sulfurtransferase